VVTGARRITINDYSFILSMPRAQSAAASPADDRRSALACGDAGGAASTNFAVRPRRDDALP